MTPKKVLQLLLAITAISNFFLLFIVSSEERNSLVYRKLFNGFATTPEKGVYYFKDPILAFKILEKLDIFEQISGSESKVSSDSDKIYFGTHADKDYCKKHRALIVQRPEIIFKETNILTGFTTGSLLQSRVIPAVGRHIQPMLNHLPKKQRKEGRFTWREDANNFFAGYEIFANRAIGHSFSCLSQTSNAIPGFQYLYRKDYVSEGIVEYSESYEGRSECFNHDKFFPKTWILYQKQPCKEFFRHFNSPEYKQLKKERGEIVYMRKIGAFSHKGRGVFPINTEEEENLRKMYKNGDLCGWKKDNNIIQYYIYNPLLLNGNKFDFRIYMLIASANPVMAFYHDGFLRVSLHKYDASSKEKGALLTNTALSKAIFGLASKNGTYEGKTVAELKSEQKWSFQRFEDYLYEEGIITDRNWLNNHLRPEFRKAIAHLLRLSQKYFMKKSSVYHLFGLDFMLDETLNLWFIEANARPALEGVSTEMKELVAGMLIDHFEIVYGLMRSRMKRVVQYVNNFEIAKRHLRVFSDELNFVNLDERREEFRKLTENYFEPEFLPSSKNKFQPIIDDNLPGAERYFGLIKEECI